VTPTELRTFAASATCACGQPRCVLEGKVKAARALAAFDAALESVP
jgi:hypothetical protein